MLEPKQGCTLKHFFTLLPNITLQGCQCAYFLAFVSRAGTKLCSTSTRGTWQTALLEMYNRPVRFLHLRDCSTTVLAADRAHLQLRVNRWRKCSILRCFCTLLIESLTITPLQQSAPRRPWFLNGLEKRYIQKLAGAEVSTKFAIGIEQSLYSVCEDSGRAPPTLLALGCRVHLCQKGDASKGARYHCCKC